METEKIQNKMSKGIVIIVFFIIVTFFGSYIVYGQQIIVVNILLFLEIVVGILFVAFYVRGRFRIKTVIVSIGIGIALSLLALAVIVVIGTTLIHEMPATYSYSVSVKGLTLYDGGLVTDIIVPIPMLNGKQVFSDEELQYKQFGNWTSLLVVTPQGKMLAFQTLDQDLSDIDAFFFKELDGRNAVTDISQDFLSPRVDARSGNTSCWVYNTSDVYGYSTQVYVDENVNSARPNTGSITFELNVNINEGSILGSKGENYQIRVCEVIPSGMKKSIPARVQIGKYSMNAWRPIESHNMRS